MNILVHSIIYQFPFWQKQNEFHLQPNSCLPRKLDWKNHETMAKRRQATAWTQMNPENFKTAAVYRRAHSWFWHSVAGLHPLAKYGLVPHSVGTMWETHISSAAAIVLSWYYQELQLVHLKQSLWAWRSFGSAGLPSVGAPQLGGTHVTSLHTVQLFCEQYCDSV